MPPLSLAIGIGLPDVRAVGGPASPTTFTADLTTQPVGAGSVASYGLTFARASSGHSVQTSAGAVATGGSLGSNDVPRYGSDGTRAGLVLEDARTNLWIQARDQTGDTKVGAPTITADDEAGPDGTVTADRLQLSGVQAAFRSVAALTTGQACRFSAWVKRKAGAGAGGVTLRISGNTDVNTQVTVQDNAWVRKALAGVGFTGNTAFLSDGRPGGAALDWEADLYQAEAGKYDTEAILTTGSSATRAGERLWHPTGSTLVDGGRLGLEVKLQPKGSSAQYATAASLWFADASNHAEVDAATAALKCTIGGVLYTTPVALSWAAGDTLEIFLAAGGGSLPTYASYRVNGGARTVLSTGSPPTAGTLTVASTLDLLCNGTANQFSAWVQTINAYRSGQQPAWA